MSVILHVVAESMSQLCNMSGKHPHTIIDSATYAQNDRGGNHMHNSGDCGSEAAMTNLNKLS